MITNQRGFISTVSQELEIGVAYGYDALGRRVSREEIVDLEASVGIERYGSRKNRESYLYDGLRFTMLAEGIDRTTTTSSGGWYTRSGREFTPTTEYLYAGGTVIGWNDIAGGSFGAGAFGSKVKPSYYGQDILGSVVLEANEDGTKQKSYDYDAYGQLIEGKYSRISDLGYTGKRIDAATGWYNYGYRDYDPMVMRFTTVDPIRSGSNWYAYVGGDPVNYVDPWGLSESDLAEQQTSSINSDISSQFTPLSFSEQTETSGVGILAPPIAVISSLPSLAAITATLFSLAITSSETDPMELVSHYTSEEAASEILSSGYIMGTSINPFFGRSYIVST